MTVNALNDTEVPKMRYRWFWNWDDRTNWDLLDHDNVYQPLWRLPASDSARMWNKRPEAFLKNMKLVIDYMSEHKLNGLIIWGFLRDNHGGIEASREVCQYANERGVKIIPGVGIDRHYGGFYCEGKNEFNLETRAEEYPNLRSMNKAGEYEPRTLCLDLPANREWVRRGFRWLYENFPIGGVNVEFGEAATCYNPACVEARKKQAGNEPDFDKDLARIMPFFMKVVHTIAPTTAISYVTYGGFTPAMQANPPLHVQVAPDFAICQWTITNMLTDLVPNHGGQHAAPTWAEGLGASPWPEGLRPPGRNYIGYLHWDAFYVRDEKGFFVDAYREAARKAYRHGFQGLDTYWRGVAWISQCRAQLFGVFGIRLQPRNDGRAVLKKAHCTTLRRPGGRQLALEIAHRIGPVRMSELPTNVDGV